MSNNIFKSFDDNDLNKITKSEEFNKVTNDKDVNDFINNKQFKDFQQKYEGKTEDEILKDAKNMSKQLREQLGDKEYAKKLDDLKNFEKFLNPEQKKKMKRLLDNLK